jgi:hypothetical protein
MGPETEVDEDVDPENPGKLPPKSSSKDGSYSNSRDTDDSNCSQRGSRGEHLYVESSSEQEDEDEEESESDYDPLPSKKRNISAVAKPAKKVSSKRFAPDGNPKRAYKRRSNEAELLRD